MEWFDAKDRRPDGNGVFIIKLQNGNECKAMFYTDGMSWTTFYGQRPTPWWSYEDEEPLYNVTHWKQRDKD